MISRRGWWIGTMHGREQDNNNYDNNIMHRYDSCVIASFKYKNAAN